MQTQLADPKSQYFIHQTKGTPGFAASVMRLVSAPRAVLIPALLLGSDLTACAESNDRAPAARDTLAQSAATAVVATHAAAGAVDPVPATLTAAGHFAEDAYDVAKASDWSKASALVDSLRATARTDEAARTGGSATTAWPGAMAGALARLDTAVAHHDRRSALVHSNEMTRLVAEATSPFHPKVPSDVILLDYYGRELEIWSAAPDIARLEQTRHLAQATWQRVRPDIVARGGMTTATKFDGIMNQLASATSPAAYAAVVTPMLDQVDALERVFTPK